MPFPEVAERIKTVARGKAPLPGWAGTHVYASASAREENSMERDEGEITPEQLARIHRIVREKHGEATALSFLFDDAEVRRQFGDLDRKWWPALAAMAHEPDADRVPTKCADEWLVAGPSEHYQGLALAAPGKWCVERQGDPADDLWRLVLGAVAIGKLYVAKASGVKRASFYGGRHLIAVYTPNSANVEDVRRARAVLRELGVVEPIPFSNDDGDELLCG